MLGSGSGGRTKSVLFTGLGAVLIGGAVVWVAADRIVSAVFERLRPDLEEQVGKPLTMTEVNGKSEVKSLTKPPTETLTHVIDGHVIQESSQPLLSRLVSVSWGKMILRRGR